MTLRRWLFVQKHAILDAWRGYEYACVQIAPGNILRHHNKYLMGYFEFLHGWRIICLSWNISGKLHWHYVCQKLGKAENHLPSSFLTWYNSHALRKTTFTNQTNGNHHHFFIPILILQLAMLHSIDKTHVLVVTVEFISLLLLNMFSFNLVSTPRKSFRFTRFRRTHANHPVVILTNHCQSYTAFLLNARCSKWPCSFFCSYWFPMIVYLRCWAHLPFESC